MKKILSITGKELKLYFGSPMALIFVGVFPRAYAVRILLGGLLLRSRLSRCARAL